MTSVEVLSRAARIYARGDIRVDAEAPIDGPEPGEVLLRVTSVGLCGSDLHWFEEGSIGDAALVRPLVLGHEIGAEIASGPRAGERVAVDPAYDCGRCEPCVAGRPNLCLTMRFAGHGTTDGAMRTYMTWPERLLSPLPDSIGDDEAPILEPLGVALHAVGLARLSAGERASVYGCGPIGLLLIQLLRARGVSTIVATDKLAHRVAAARAMGATEAFTIDDATGPDTSKGRSLARAEAVDVGFEVSGADEALSDAIAAVRPGGQVILVGIPPGDKTTFEAAAARRKELSLQECRRMLPADLPRAIELVADGAVDIKSLITARFSLAEAPAAFAALASRSGLKVIVKPNSD